MATKKLLVTGWNGFMASHFLDRFVDDDKYEVIHFKGDITHEEDCVRNCRDIDTIINFAALTYLPPSWDNPEAYSEVNYQGVENLLRCHGMFTRFIQISTSHVYGNQEKMPITLGVNEPQPNDPYSIAKLSAEKAIASYANKFNFNYLIIRPFNNFGPRQSKNFVIPAFIEQAITKNHIKIRGNTQREFVYVKDNVKAIKYFLDTGAQGFRQVCQGKPYYIEEVAKMIANSVGDNTTYEIVASDRQHDIEALWGVPTLPDGFEFTPMPQAIQETVDYYKSLYTQKVEA